jgi:hypothetical protein
MRRLGVLLPVAAVALAVVGPAAPARAAGSGPAAFVVAVPASGASVDATGSYFVVHADGGATVHQTVLLTNHGTGSVTAQVRGVDAGSALGRGAVYGLPSDTPAGVGTWIVPDAPTVTLRAGRQTAVSFDVRVPPGTAPGQHLGGISVSARAVSGGPESSASANVAVDVTMESQRVLGVEVDVPGALTPRLEVTSASVVGDRGARRLVVKVTNAGNALVRATGALDVAALDVHRDVVVRTFVPGTSVDVDAPWPESAGSRTYPANLALDYGGTRLDWSAAVGIPGATSAHPNGTDGSGTRASASRNRTSPVPWVLGLAAAALVVGGGMALVARRRAEPAPRSRRRARAAAVERGRRARRRA